MLHGARRKLPPTPERFTTPSHTEPAVLNPPGFRWPDDRVRSYDLQIARTDAFAAADVITVEDWPLSVYMPERPLEPGTWYWRVRPHHPKGIYAWSEPVSFEIGGDLPSIPMPATSGIIARLEALGHPRLFLTREDLEGWREAIQGERSDLWYRLTSELASKPDTADPERIEGASVTNHDTADLARAVTRRATALSEYIQTAALSCLLTGNREHGKAAREHLLALSGWDRNGSTNVLFNDTAFREVVVGLARGFDWLSAAGLLSSADRGVIIEAARQRGEDFYNWYQSRRADKQWPYESHQSGGMVNFAELAVAFAGVIPEAGDWLRYTLHMLTANYPAYGRSDGSWSEGPEYWSLTFGRHIPSLWAVARATGVDLFAHPFLKETGNYILYSTPPWSMFFPFGDHHQDRVSQAFARNMQRLAWIYQNPHFAWYAQTPPLEGGFEDTAAGFLLFKQPPKAAEPTDLPLARVFPDTGLAVLRTHLADAGQDIHFMIKANPFGSVSHAHADQGNFTLSAYGVPLVIASGYYPLYGDEHHYTWTRQSWAHNVPLLGGKGQATRTAQALGQIEHFAHSDLNLIDYVRIEAARAYSAPVPGSVKKQLDAFIPGLSERIGSVPVTRWCRHVVYVRPNLFILFDDVEASEPIEFEWLLHTVNAAELDGEGRGLTVGNAGVRLSVVFATDRTVRLSQDDQFTFPPRGRHAGRPKQWHIKARIEGTRRTHRFLSFLFPHREGETVPVMDRLHAEEWDGVVLSRDGERTMVAFGRTVQTGEAERGRDRTAERVEATKTAANRGPAPESAGDAEPRADQAAAAAVAGMQHIRQLAGISTDAAVVVLHEGAARWLYASQLRRLEMRETALIGSKGGVWEFSVPADLLLMHADGGIVLEIASDRAGHMTSPVGRLEFSAGSTRRRLL